MVLTYEITVCVTLMRSVVSVVNFTSVVFTCGSPGGAQQTQVHVVNSPSNPEENRNYDMKKFIVAAARVTA